MTNILFLFKKSVAAAAILWVLYLLLSFEVIDRSLYQLLIIQAFILVFFLLIETYGWLKEINKRKSK